MKLGEFLAHARLFGRTKLQTWLKTGFSRMSDKVITDMWKAQSLPANLLDKGVESVSDESLKSVYAAVQATQLMAPSTQSVVSIGEDAMSLSVERLGEIDFFAVATRKPTICDFKPIQVEVAIARVHGAGIDGDEPVQVLRFANRVPLQFDKAACAIVKAITTVNWRSYGLRQPKDALPTGPYILAVSIVSPFIKFKNASKETIDASDELVEEIRRALMQAGQRLSRHLSRETKAADLEEKIQHIEKFGPVLVDTLVRITKSPDKRKTAAYEGLKKILGRDTDEAQTKLASAETALDEANLARKKRLKAFRDEDSALEASRAPTPEELEAMEAEASEDSSSEENFGEVSGDSDDAPKSKKKKKSDEDILSVFAPEKTKGKATKKDASKKGTEKKAAEKKPEPKATAKKATAKAPANKK
jgi:DNA topoisomerase-6 subunit B